MGSICWWAGEGGGIAQLSEHHRLSLGGSNS